MERKVQLFVHDCPMCICTEPCHNRNLRPLCPHIHVTEIDVFPRSLCATPTPRPDTAYTVNALLTVCTQHVYMPQQSPADKNSAFTLKPLTELIEKAGKKSTPHSRACSTDWHG